MYRCKKCGKVFTSKSLVRRHMIQSHGYDSTDIGLMELMIIEEVADSFFSTTSDTPDGGSFGGGGASGSWDSSDSSSSSSD